MNPSVRNNHENCECEYCEYVDIQNSMTSLPIKRSFSTIQSEVFSDDEEASEAGTPFTVHLSLMYHQWHNFLILLRLLGSCPLSMVKPKESDKEFILPKLVFNWVSWVSLYTAIVDVLRIAVCIIYYKDWKHFALGKEYSNTIEDWLFLCINFAIPFQHCWTIIGIWITSSRGAKLCNAWLEVECQLHQMYPISCHRVSRIRKWRRILTVVIGTFLIGISSSIASEMILVNPSNEYGLRRLVRIIPLSFFESLMLVEEVRVLLLYFTASEAFNNIGYAIQLEIKKRRRISNHVVTNWTLILQRIRNNVKLTGHIQAPQQIAYFLASIVFFTIIFFITIQALLTGKNEKKIVIALLLGNAFIVRTLMKIMMAEKIVSEEQKIADMLIKTDDEIFDLTGKLEACKIIDIIQQKPSKLSLNGYVTIEKKMIPKMMGHVVAYLVVLIQFHLGYYVNKGSTNCLKSNSTVSSS